jgi:GxxExxY protein
MINTDFSYSIRGAVFTVYNSLGFDHKEHVYQKALAQEFKEKNIPFVGHYHPDFVVDQKIILELKAVEFIPKTYEQQLVHYLKSTNYQLGLLINFGASKLYIKRLVWTLDPCKSVTNLRKS